MKNVHTQNEQAPSFRLKRESETYIQREGLDVGTHTEEEDNPSKHTPPWLCLFPPLVPS